MSNNFEFLFYLVYQVYKRKSDHHCYFNDVTIEMITNSLNLKILETNFNLILFLSLYLNLF